MITKVFGIELVDSRGLPAVGACITLDNGTSAMASVPSGASVGSYEAHELRDNDARFFGKGVTPTAIIRIKGIFLKSKYAVLPSTG